MEKKTNTDDWPTWEELEDSFIDKSPDIKTTCLSCGFTENTPDFIYGEMSRKKYHLKIRKKVSTLHCQKCFKETAISAYHLENQ